MQLWLLSSAHDTSRSFKEDGLAMRMCRLCLEILQRICNGKIKVSGRSTSSGENHHLGNELEQLYLWREHFEPGSLDKALNFAVDLRDVVLKALLQICRILISSGCSTYSFASPMDQTDSAESTEFSEDTIVQILRHAASPRGFDSLDGRSPQSCYT